MSGEWLDLRDLDSTWVAEGVVNFTDGRELHVSPSNSPESEETRSQGPSAKGKGSGSHGKECVSNYAWHELQVSQRQPPESKTRDPASSTLSA